MEIGTEGKCSVNNTYISCMVVAYENNKRGARHEKSFHFASANGSVLFTEHFAQIFIYIYTIPINHISFVPCININSICVFKGGIVSGHKDSHTFVPGCVEARTSNGP